MKNIDSKSGVIIHIIDKMSPAGEYTICGIAWLDTDFNKDGFQAIDSLEGSIDLCTCKDCKETLNYYKQLK
jgi:hypothetical protein